MLKAFLHNIITIDENSQFYLCGYSCDNAILLQLANEKYFITDGRYLIEAKQNVDRFTSVIETKNLLKTTREIVRKSKIKTLEFDPAEWKVSSFKEFSDKLNIRLKPKKDNILLKRAIKDNKELAKIKQSAKLNKECFNEFANILKKEGKNKTEKELNFLSIQALSRFGLQELSFAPITAINQNSAKPHASATKTKIKDGDLILFDGGVKYQRYCSDRTRIGIFNEDINFSIYQKFSNKKIQKIYDIVLKAHDEAIKRVKPGMRAKELDNIARSVIKKAGYEKYFVHSLGHGVGLNIHEYPYINQKSDMILEENMVFTIEPGIYLENEFGIRIEDMGVLKSDGFEVF